MESAQVIPSYLASKLVVSKRSTLIQIADPTEFARFDEDTAPALHVVEMVQLAF